MSRVAQAPPRARRAPPASPASRRAPAAASLPAGLIARVAIALVGVALLLLTFLGHPLGDYFTESDFYEYAAGGRGIRQGVIDPARYVIIGPLYEFVLAGLSFLPSDLFRLASLLSIAAACSVLALWFRLLRRRAGDGVALWTLLFVAANPVFFRYAYTASTDMLAMALQAASLFALLAMGGGRAPLWAGLFAALAILTRYTSIFLVPGALAVWIWGGAPHPRRRPADAAWYAIGLGIVLIPWLAFTLSSGTIPGENLFRNYGFYATESAERNVQDAPQGEAAAGEQGSPAARWARTLLPHLRADMEQLLGWPLALACVAGLLAAVVRRRDGRLLPVWIQGLFLFLVLATAFVSDRYSMPLLPIYLSMAALAVAWIPGGLGLAGRALPIGWLVALVPLALSIRSSVELQREVAGTLPIEVLPSARALRAAAPAEAAVIARKSAIAHYAGVRPVPFPRLKTLAELAAHARETRAEFLFFSWYEGELRPEFWYLLDTTASVPGLERLHATSLNPSILYRIRPGFGSEPSWLADSSARRVHVTRGYVRVVPDGSAAEMHRWLGVQAASSGELPVALDHFAAMTRGRPDLAEGWMFTGMALMSLGRPAEAVTALERARTIQPLDPVVSARLQQARAAADSVARSR